MTCVLRHMAFVVEHTPVLRMSYAHNMIEQSGSSCPICFAVAATCSMQAAKCLISIYKWMMCSVTCSLEVSANVKYMLAIDFENISAIV